MTPKRVISFLLILVFASMIAVGCSSTNDQTQTLGDTAVSKEDNNKTDATNPSSGIAGDNNSSGKADDNSSDNADVTSSVKDGAKEEKTEDKAANAADYSGELSITAKDGGEFKEDGNRYIFTKGGEYHVRGTCFNRMIYIDAADADLDIHLEGVNMTSEIGALIYVENAEEVTISATDGTNNELNDQRPARKNKNEDSEYGNAAIYSKDDLKFKGRGRLTVNGSYNNGIGCKNDIKIKNLTLIVNAANNGIKGNDSVTVESGNITIKADNGSGIKTENTHVSNKGNQKGYITITGGKIDISSADDPIDAAFDLILDSKNATITTNK